MEKQLRTDAGFYGTPIRLLWRSKRKSERNDGKAGAAKQANLTSRDTQLTAST